MSFTKELLIAAISRIVVAFLGIVSKEVRYLLESYIKDLYRRAKETANPADDMFVEFVAQILCIELEEKKEENYPG